MVWLGYGSLEAFWNPLRCQEGKPKTVVLAERGLVHSRALELEGYVAFLRSLFEHIAVLQTHYVIHQLVKLLPIRFTDSFGYYLISGTSLLAIPWLPSLRREFGDGANFVIGSWSAPNPRFHDLIRGVGFWRLLQKNDFHIFLVDEFKTIKCCPHCEKMTQKTFWMVPNPRPL